MILVTGASGLIGSHLCKRLVAEGYGVVGLVHDRTNYILESLRNHFNFFSYCGDIRDERFLYPLLEKFRIKTVFHTAAQLPYTVDSDLVGVNIKGTLNLLEHCGGVEEFIYASSMAVYFDPPSYIPVDEAHIAHPLSLYGVTKRIGELLCGSYATEMRVLILRYAGVYGVSSDKNRVVNNFIRCALMNYPLIVNGDGSQSSDFTYVDDIVDGTYLAWEKQASGVYNIGSGQETTLEELAKKVIGITNSKSEIIKNGDKIERPFRFYLDITKARKDFDYSPRLLEEGLRSYVKEFSQ